MSTATPMLCAMIHAVMSGDMPIENGAKYRYFTSAQVGQIIDQLPFGAEKVEAGVMLYPRVLDKANWHVVYDGFDFRVDARNLARRVATM